MYRHMYIHLIISNHSTVYHCYFTLTSDEVKVHVYLENLIHVLYVLF